MQSFLSCALLVNWRPQCWHARSIASVDDALRLVPRGRESVEPVVAGVGSSIALTMSLAASFSLQTSSKVFARIVLVAELIAPSSDVDSGPDSSSSSLSITIGGLSGWEAMWFDGLRWLCDVVGCALLFLQCKLETYGDTRHTSSGL